MIRKYGIFLLFFILIAMLAACSSDESASGGSGSDMDVQIEDASYILAGDSGVSLNEDSGLLSVTLAITNKSDQSIHVSPYDGIVLYDEGEQKSPETDIFDAKVDLGATDFGDIGPEKMKKVNVLFYVENGKEYEIGIKPMMNDPGAEPEEVTVPLNTADYAESFEALYDPEKALIAFVETIYFDQENPDYERLVSADKEALQEDAKELFEDQLNTIFLEGVPEEELDKFYETYKSLLRDKAEITAEIIANANDKAVIRFDYQTLPLDVYDEARKYTQEYRENTGEWDSEAAEEYALSKFDHVLESIDPKSNRNELQVIMIQEDGKWKVDMSDYNGERLAEAFAAGMR